MRLLHIHNALFSYMHMYMYVCYDVWFFPGIFSCVCIVLSVFGFIYPAERLGSAVGQISPAAAQTTAEWANRPGMIEYRFITTLCMYVLIIIILMWGIP